MSSSMSRLHRPALAALLLAALAAALPLAAAAAEAGASLDPLAPGLSGRQRLERLVERVRHEQKGIETLEARFVQTQESSMLLEPEESTGTFSYAAPDKVRWEYDLAEADLGGDRRRRDDHLVPRPRAAPSSSPSVATRRRSSSTSAPAARSRRCWSTSRVTARFPERAGEPYALELEPRYERIRKRLDSMTLWIDARAVRAGAAALRRGRRRRHRVPLRGPRDQRPISGRALRAAPLPTGVEVTCRPRPQPLTARPWTWPRNWPRPGRGSSLARDGRARRGRLTTAARHDRDPGLHAGRDAGRGQGAGAADPRRASAPRSCSPTSTTWRCGRGSTVIERLGGLHAFTGWRRPILTDSGGYQVFSLAAAAQGRRRRRDLQEPRRRRRGAFTPEGVVGMQAAHRRRRRDGARRVPALAGRARRRRGVVAAHPGWAGRSLAALAPARAAGRRGALFGIVQGSVLRRSPPARGGGPRGARARRRLRRLRDRRRQRRRARAAAPRGGRGHGPASCPRSGRAT